MRILSLVCLLCAAAILCSSCGRRDRKIMPTGSQYPEKSILDSLTILDSLVDAFRHVDVTKSLRYAEAAINYPGVSEFPGTAIRARLIKGKALLDIRDDSSYYYLHAALSISDSCQIETYKPEILFFLGKIYVTSSDLKQALILFDSVTVLAAQTSNYGLLSSTYNEMGGIQDFLHDRENARKLFETAYTIAEKHCLPRQMAAALGNLALFEPDTSQAIQMLHKAISYLKPSSATEDAVAQLYVNLGYEFTNADSSKKYNELAIRTVDPQTSSEVILVAYNNLAYAYAERKEYSKAELCLTENAIPLAEKSGNMDWLASLYDTYADVLIMNQKFKEASFIEKKAYGYRRQAYDEKAAGQVRLLSSLLDVKNKELLLKAKDDELLKKANSIRFLILLFVLVIGTGSISVLYAFQRNKLKTERQRFQSARKLIDLEEAFKSNLAMELHDMTSPMYTTLVRQIEEVNIPDNSVKEELYSSLQLLSEKIRRISHEMAGGFYGDMPFADLVRDLCEEMRYRTTAQIKVFLDDSEFAFNQDKAKHVLRIIQEILTNGVKYVKAGQLQLNISTAHNQIRIAYHDNGPGFDPSDKDSKGLGLNNIFERTRILGGSAVLESEPGKGTHWRIEIPMV